MLATPGLFHRHKGKKLLRHQIYIVMRHKIFEYSFTASLPGIISVKGFFFSHTVQVSVNIYIYNFFYLTSDGHLKLESLETKSSQKAEDQFSN